MQAITCETPSGIEPTHFTEVRSSQGILRLHPDFVDEIPPSLVTNSLYTLHTDAASRAEVRTVSGRGATARLVLPSGRVLVLREYRRGGYARLFTRRTFLWLPFASVQTLRPFVELTLVEELRRQGVHVPQPALAFVVSGLGGFCYRGAIATEEIANAENMLDLLKQDASPERLGAIAYRAGIQARRMLDCGVFHADFHLGNNLCTGEGEVFLIDFDKAYRFAGNPEPYEQLLVSRWQRSVEKHTRRRPDVARTLMGELVRGLRE